MLKAILFDLDNTLILFDETKFYTGFLHRIWRNFADIMPPEVFQDRLISSTRSLKKNSGSITNKEYFMTGFSRGYENRREELWRRFEYFYDHEYDKLKANVTLPESLHDVFDELIRKDLKLVLASNPLFPRSVQMKRLAWAGLGDIRFSLVTHIENMSFCKPRVEYYFEICRNIDENPAACLMVGNDPVNDMVAAKAGVKTFLTIDALTNDDLSLKERRELKTDQITDVPTPDFQGPLAEVLSAVRLLEKENQIEILKPHPDRYKKKRINLNG